MTPARPPLGAPWDKRLTADALAAALAEPPRPFDAARGDIDLFDAINEHLKAALLSPLALTPDTYAPARFAVNEPAAGPWTLAAEPVGENGPIPSAEPLTEGGAYELGAGESAALTLNVPAPVRVSTLAAVFRLGGGIYGVTGNGGNSLSYSREDAAPSRYRVTLTGPGGAVLLDAECSPEAGRTLNFRRVYAGSMQGFPSYAEFRNMAACDFALNTVLDAGNHTLTFTALSLSPDTPAGDVNSYPAASPAPAPGLLGAPAWPDGRGAAGAAILTLHPERPASFTASPDALNVTGAGLVRLPLPLGPSGDTPGRLTCEFTVSDDALTRGWGGQLAFLFTALPAARTHEELPALLTAARYAHALTFTHAPRADHARWTHGLTGGARHRLELTHRVTTEAAGSGGLTSSRRLSVVTWKLFNMAGELVGSGEQRRELAYATRDIESFRAALLIPPTLAPLAGAHPAVTVHRWQEWRE